LNAKNNDGDDGDDGDDDQSSTEEKIWKKNNSRYKIQLTVESSRV
jgi:hypothetical protein